MAATSDPEILIEEQRPGYVRYRRVDGRRWEVWGTASCDVTPTTDQNDVLDRRVAHAIFGRERAVGAATRRVSLSDLLHKRFCELRFRGLFAARLVDRQYEPPPALRPRVGQVIGGCSEEQMTGIYARRVITVMQNGNAGRDRPIVQLPREAVRVGSLPIDSELPITSRVASPDPKPAFVALRDLVPKTRSNKWHAGKYSCD